MNEVGYMVCNNCLCIEPDNSISCTNCGSEDMFFRKRFDIENILIGGVRYYQIRDKYFGDVLADFASKKEAQKYLEKYIEENS